MSTESVQPSLSRILVGTDLSARSDRAVERAVLLANSRSSVLTILHLIAPNLPTQNIDRQRDDANSQIESYVNSLPAAKTIKWEVQVALGKNIFDVPAVIEKSNVDLIVLGIHRNETRRPFRGTTSERTIRHGNMPVLVVKKRPISPYRRVLLAVDFSECSSKLVNFAASFLPDAHFQLVHAYDTPDKAFLTDKAIRREVSESHHKQMECFLRDHCAPLQLEPTQIVRQGLARQVIFEEVRRHQPDLLMAGTHGRGAIGRAILGSVAEDLLNHMPCDVLAVPP
jgi:universal stress protein E